MDIILATNNKNKLKEMKALLSGICKNIYSLSDKNINVEVEENGTTFEQNAIIKASEICKLSNLPAVADDSGLCVQALDGAPGVLSARYAGEPSDDENNNQKLLQELKSVEEKTKTVNRKACFVSCLAIVFPDGRVMTQSAELDGEIIFDRRGTNGFGYDPYFFIPSLNKTMAELEFSEKNKISHRAKAFKLFAEKLEKMIKND